ncbi:MAG: hypothetical protein IJ190_04630 [Prevotella sp.]|nr:hypothetical protein [Prevotella sp.]
MTKRISHFLLSLMLSVMIISLGTGVTFMHCMHSGMVEMATLSDLTNDNGCEGECMEITVLQLDNLSQAPVISFDFHNTFQLSATLQTILAYWQRPFEVVKAPAIPIPQWIKGPPRDYLSLMHILLI